jgi:hypothetical protein
MMITLEFNKAFLALWKNLITNWPDHAITVAVNYFLAIILTMHV